jgi:tellurite resistance protein
MTTPNELLAKVLLETTEDDAILDVIALSTCADGVVQKSEVEALTRMARELPSLRGLTKDELDDRVRASFARLEAAGLEGRLKELGEAAKTDDLKRRLFSAAAIVQHADGHLANEENAFLLDLADVLGLDDATVRAIVDEIDGELGGD